MTRITNYVAAIFMSALLPNSTVLADAAPAPMKAFPNPLVPDSASLPIARQIVAIALTSEKTNALIDGMTQSIIRDQIARWLLGVEVTDPALAAIIDDFSRKSGPIVRAALLSKIPDMNEAAAHGYARLFSQSELEAILTFAKTTAGSKFLNRAIIVGMEGEMVESNVDMWAAAVESEKPLLPEFIGKMRTYFSTHPDFERKMREAATQEARRKGLPN